MCTLNTCVHFFTYSVLINIPFLNGKDITSSSVDPFSNVTNTGRKFHRVGNKGSFKELFLNVCIAMFCKGCHTEVQYENLGR